MTNARGVNADGSVVVGEDNNPGGNTEAYIARVGFVPATPDTPPDTPPAVPPGATPVAPPGATPVAGLVTLNDLGNSLASVGGLMNAGRYITALPLSGAHHRPLLSYHGLASGGCVWASGDVAGYGHQEDGTAGLVEVGGCYDVLPGRLRLGIAGGKSYLDQDLSLAGDSDLDGGYLLTELDYAVPGVPLLVSVTGLLGTWDADVARGYLNAGTLDRSFGDTEVDAWALRTRLDWVDAFHYAGIHVSPRLAYTVSQVEVEGYTETGGGFPVRFDPRDLTSHELRYGLDAEMQVAQATWVRGTAEGVHRFDEDEPVLGGQVLGLFSFALAGRDNETDWARLGAEVEHHVTDDLRVSASVHGSTEGEDPVVSGGLTIGYAF